MDTLYTETQGFPWWVYALLAPTLIIFGYPMYTGDYVSSWTLVTLGIVLVVIALILFWRLRTTITDTDLQFSIQPWVNKSIPWSEVQTAEVIDYGFVGGWGIRLWTGFGTVYNTRGSYGLHVTLKSGKQFVLGTQKPERLREIVDQIKLNSQGSARQ